MFHLTSGTETLALAALLGYALGSIPFGLLITRALGLGDLRAIGSGNIGATNVLRTGNKGAALATLLLDGLKGALAVWALRFGGFGADAVQIGALAAFLGHLFPLWLGFRGGKGVATFLGIFLALIPLVGLALCATWGLVAALGRYSSLASITTAASSTFWLLALGGGQFFLLGALLTLLIFWKHAPNIARLKAGQEPKIGQKKG